MQTAQGDVGEAERFGAAPSQRDGREDRPWLRLALGVAGLAALIGWGVLNHAQTGPTADSTPSAPGPLLEGHGKWTGYTSR